MLATGTAKPGAPFPRRFRSRKKSALSRKAYEDQISPVVGRCARLGPGMGREARPVDPGQPPDPGVQVKPRRSAALAARALGDRPGGERAVEGRQRHADGPLATGDRKSTRLNSSH